MKTDSTKIAQAMVNTLMKVKKRLESQQALTASQKRVLKRINNGVRDLVVVKGGKK